MSASTAIRRPCATSARRSGSPPRRPCTRTSATSSGSGCCGATRPSRARSRCWSTRRASRSSRPGCRSSGQVAAGAPVLAEENIEEYVPVPGIAGGDDGEFVLRVKGDSMKDAGILDGDYVIVRRQETAADGEIVVALVGDEAEATVKRFFRESDHVRLQPENAALEPILTTRRAGARPGGRASAGGCHEHRGAGRPGAAVRRGRRPAGRRSRSCSTARGARPHADGEAECPVCDARCASRRAGPLRRVRSDAGLGPRAATRRRAAAQRPRPAPRSRSTSPRSPPARRQVPPTWAAAAGHGGALAAPDVVARWRAAAGSRIGRLPAKQPRGGRRDNRPLEESPDTVGQGGREADPGKPAGKCHRNTPPKRRASREPGAGKGEKVR